MSGAREGTGNKCANIGKVSLNAFLLFVLSILSACGGSDQSSSTPSTAPSAPIAPVQVSLPAIRHFFTIVLENENYQATFGANSPAAYLSQQLTAQGTLLTNYYAIGHESLGNYIALMSGQAPNVSTEGDCPVYQDFAPSSPAQIDGNGQAIGQGCVFPAAIQTVANQLTANQFTWRGYMESMPAACTHPALNATDNTQTATASNEYANRHNPFIYFHSIVDTSACPQNVVALTQLTADLQQTTTTPNYVLITPNLCHDGHDMPCADGEPGGLVSADSFLRTWVPQLLASPAYQQDGFLLITIDEAASDSSACCGEQPGPNSSQPGITGPGGGRVGAVVLSKYVLPGNIVSTPYNHYSALRTVEDIFGLPHLGFAGQSGLASFGSDVFP